MASVNACTLMTFLAYARHRGLDLVGYHNDAEGVLGIVEGKYRFAEINLHPHIRVKSPEDAERAREIIQDAQRQPFRGQFSRIAGEDLSRNPGWLEQGSAEKLPILWQDLAHAQPSRKKEAAQFKMAVIPTPACRGK